jgi:flagellar biosynthesis protein FlhG
MMNNFRGINRIGDAGADKPRLYAIASGKGGVGKSVIAFNLAQFLSQANRVLLLDGDFLMGNLHLLANIAPAHGWQNLCIGGVTMPEAVKPINDNLDLLASIGGRSDELLPEIKNLASSLGGLRKQAEKYDFVVIDTASGILPHTNLILNAVDEVVLVTTPELTSISDCYALYKILISNDENLLASLLVNREDQKEEAEYIYRKFVTITDQFLGRSPAFFGQLGNDTTVVDSIASQKGLADFAPNSRIAGQFATLAASLSGAETPADFNLETINYSPPGADIKE